MRRGWVGGGGSVISGGSAGVLCSLGGGHSQRCMWCCVRMVCIASTTRSRAASERPREGSGRASPTPRGNEEPNTHLGKALLGAVFDNLGPVVARVAHKDAPRRLTHGL